MRYCQCILVVRVVRAKRLLFFAWARDTRADHVRHPAPGFEERLATLLARARTPRERITHAYDGGQVDAIAAYDVNIGEEGHTAPSLLDGHFASVYAVLAAPVRDIRSPRVTTSSGPRGVVAERFGPIVHEATTVARGFRSLTELQAPM